MKQLRVVFHYRKSYPNWVVIKALDPELQTEPERRNTLEVPITLWQDWLDREESFRQIQQEAESFWVKGTGREKPEAI